LGTAEAGSVAGLSCHPTNSGKALKGKHQKNTVVTYHHLQHFAISAAAAAADWHQQWYCMAVRMHHASRQCSHGAAA